MFNTPILDVAIGLVFVFLLYSLLATSIKEAIATGLALRARMLKKGIIVGMLSDTSKDSRIKSILKSMWESVKDVVWMIFPRPKKKPEDFKIGDYFYDHPLIKNYGSSPIFPYPSYLPTGDFSTILIDELKNDFDRHQAEILRYKNLADPKTGVVTPYTEAELQNDPDAVKIKNLLEYYAHIYLNAPQPTGVTIDRETLAILQMHLRNSLYSLDTFKKKLETWFDGTMDRVSGWYKRQVQVILFIIGVIIAIIFNVDTVEIVKKLSKDDKLRDQVVQSAIAYSKTNTVPPKDSSVASAASIHDTEKKFSQVDSFLNKDIKDVNSLLALGYDDYGRTDVNFVNGLRNKTWIGFFYIIHNKDSATKVDKAFDSLYLRDSVKITQGMKLNKDSLKMDWYYRYQLKNYPIHVKTAFIWYTVSNQKRKWIGFFILAFAICLGAPFWFDMLNKFINLRGSGKKEGGETSAKKTKAQPPITVNISNAQPGEEAVG